MAVTTIRTLQPLAEAGHRMRLLTLLAALPLFASTFHYVPDVLPLYYLSKLWPFLTLPVAAIGYFRLKLPARLLYVAGIAYLISIPPFMAMLYLQSSLYEATLTVVKFMPLTFYFSLSLMLAWLRPTSAELRQSITVLGTVTYVVMVVLWVTVPASNYRNEWFPNTIFLSDDGQRGARIQMPMFFGLLLIFQLCHDLVRRFRLIDLCKLLLCFAVQLTIYKERIPIAFSLLIVMLTFVSSMMRSRILGVLVLGFLGAGTLAAGLVVLGLGSLEGKFGGSLSVRIDTTVLAWNYIVADPLRWIVGVGATTRYASFTTAMMFRDPFFVLQDIGWLGVVFEAGLIGSLFIAAMYAFGIWVAEATLKDKDGVMPAMADYALYIAASSVIYSPTYLPAEIAFVTAVAVYLLRTYGGQPGRQWNVSGIKPMI